MRIVLGPGLAPGLAGIGVLLELEEQAIHVNEVIGANSGALVAALWATQKDLTSLTRIIAHLPWADFVVTSALGSADPLYNALQLLTRRASFVDTHRNMAAVVCNPRKGAGEILREGSVAWAVRSSMAVPGLFHPIESGSMLDGGAYWWQAVDEDEKVRWDDTLWVLPDLLGVPGERSGFPSGSVALATYVAMNWTLPSDVGPRSVLSIPPIGALFSFAQAEDWIEAGKVAAKKWLEK